jgi:hypothetical protein
MNRPAISAFRPLRRLATATNRALSVPAVAIASIAVLAVSVATRANAAELGANSGISILAIASHTPAWVWLVLAGLIWLGLARTRDREVGLRGLVLFPLLLAASAISNLIGGGLAAAMLGGLGIGALLGLAAGIALERRHSATKLDWGRVRLPGEWTSLVVVLVVFATRYAKVVIANIDPALTVSDGFEFASAAVSGFFAAMLLSRAVMRLRVALA